MVAVWPTEAPTFEKNPNMPLVLFDNRDRVPFNTPTPTRDGFLVICFNSRVGCRKKSFRPVLNDVKTMVGLPAKSRLWVHELGLYYQTKMRWMRYQKTDGTISNSHLPKDPTILYSCLRASPE